MTASTTPQLTQLARMDWPWKSEDPSIHIILISDEQFVNMANRPDEAVVKMYPWADDKVSLRDYCREAAARGAVRQVNVRRMLHSGVLLEIGTVRHRVKQPLTGPVSVIEDRAKGTLRTMELRELPPLPPAGSETRP